MQLEKELLKQKARKLLEQLLSVYTPSGQEGLAKGIFQNIADELNLNLYVTSTNSFFLGDGEILLASHIDTVPGYIPPSISDNEITGRGAVDAKGPLASMILASWIMNERGCKVQVGALSDEENKSAGARELVSSGKRFSHIIVGEPTNTTHIAVEYRGLLRINVNCHGKPEHSSSATNNIILKYIPAILESSQLPSQYSSPSIVPTIVRSGDSPNVTPSDFYVHFDVRYPYGISEGDIISKMSEKFEGCDLTVGESIPPVKVGPSTPAVRALMRGLLQQGVKPSLVRKGGTSDMNLLISITPSIATYGPGDSRLEHTEFERITLDEIYIATLTYVNALEELCLKR
ncbi:MULTISPECIES: N-acetyl-lysine deacetylase [Metallosphaera]|uniref:N-acetyl-lysine deacetylase n=1 Tax=Metallosphaera TaxID=41980 RepID=UPI001F06818C|nr:N-acetyl-lysine deacetylase [Metallosphaera sedula]MCH1770927.1 N-acetyl-lysine deacetylase [Metallosphaera sedula]MCP6729284.1 N-acetyl-lysine deacetylase [Metallosphaera sedula]